MRTSLRHLSTPLALAAALALAACQGSPDEPSAKEPPVPGVHDVTAVNVQFQPPAIEVRPGTTVTWHFKDGSIAHDVKGDGFGSPVQKNGTFSHRFDRAGTFSYRCTLHANMTGRVIVQ